MLILRNMCCYRSVSRLSVLVCMRVNVCIFRIWNISIFMRISIPLCSLILSLLIRSVSFTFDISLLVGMTLYIPLHSCAVLRSFILSHTSFLDRHFCSFVCALLICTWLHNNAQFYSAEIEYFGLNARRLKSCRRSIYKKNKRRRTQDSVSCVCVLMLSNNSHVCSHQHLHWPRRTMTCISSSYIATHPLSHVHILIWPRIDFYYIVMLCMKITFIYGNCFKSVQSKDVARSENGCARFKENRSTDDLLHFVHSQ